MLQISYCGQNTDSSNADDKTKTSSGIFDRRNECKKYLNFLISMTSNISNLKDFQNKDLLSMAERLND